VGERRDPADHPVGRTVKDRIDWPLIARLSLFGVAMALGTVFVIPPNVEPVCWLVVFVTCAVLIARARSSKHFVHGLLVSMANSIWVTTAHVTFTEAYFAGHPREAAMAAGMSAPRLMMIVTGPLVGVVSGLVLGLFAFGASKLVKPVG
jgi:hypothetical protein